MRLERETFGPVLRAARERRGISIQQLADDTKVSVELWTGLEDNDFSRWPERIYARTYIRDYASRVGLDPEAIINEFCRLFPEHGDRRGEGLMRAHAAILQHELEWEDDPPPVTVQRNRRASDRAVADAFVTRNFGRLLAIALDITMVSALTVPAVLLRFPIWHSFAIAGVTYHAVGVFLSGRTFGIALSDRCMKIFRTMPVTRRLASSHAETQ